MLLKVVVVVPHSQSKPITCWHCSKITLQGVFCEHCQTILDYPTNYSPSHFEVLGIPESLLFDENLLRSRFYELSKRLHPDRFATSPSPAPQYALRWTTALNRAYQTLRSKEERTSYLIEKYLGPNLKASQSSVPTDLAEAYFEVQDLLSEGELAPIVSFQKELESKLTESQKHWEVLAKTFEDSTDKKTAAKALQTHEIREKYLRSMLSDIERRVNP